MGEETLVNDVRRIIEMFIAKNLEQIDEESKEKFIKSILYSKAKIQNIKKFIETEQQLFNIRIAEISHLEVKDNDFEKKFESLSIILKKLNEQKKNMNGAAEIITKMSNAMVSDKVAEAKSFIDELNGSLNSFVTSADELIREYNKSKILQREVFQIHSSLIK